MQVSTKLTGNLEADLARFEKKVQEQVLLEGVAAMANVIYEEARTLVPVRTGLLKDSIYRAFSPERSTDSLKTYRVSWNKAKAPHGQLIEFGTSKMAAQPFMRPAFDRIDYAFQVGKAKMTEKLS